MSALSKERADQILGRSRQLANARDAVPQMENAQLWELLSQQIRKDREELLGATDRDVQGEVASLYDALASGDPISQRDIFARLSLG